MDTPPNVDYIYWTFTAAAQSVAAFVGLLLAGYALAHSLMESSRERDETLDEIYTALRLTWHRWLTLLAVLTCLAIVLSMIVVFTNRWEFPGKYLFAALVAAVDLASVVCGLAFIVETTHPRRYIVTAEKVLAARQPELHLSGETVPVGRFFEFTTRLERALRKLVASAELFIEEPPAGRRTHSVRQLTDALLANERIDADFHRELGVLQQYRNLVYHGHVSTADKSMLDRVQAATKRLEKMGGRGDGRPGRSDGAGRPEARTDGGSGSGNGNGNGNGGGGSGGGGNGGGGNTGGSAGPDA